MLFATALSAFAEEIVTVSGRKDATQSYLLMHESAPPKAVAVLFPGGEGLLKLRLEEDSVKFVGRNNFLVRTRGLMRDTEVAVAIIDAPSDLQRRGYSDVFRQGSDHAADVSAVVDDLRRRFKTAKIFLVGTSRGTISAAYAGRVLGARVDGIVLTSTLFNADRSGSGLSGFDFAKLNVPVLFVHHAQDDCIVTPYTAAKRLSENFPLITVHGGTPAQSPSCEALSAHGYFGKEAETVSAIKNWMLGRAYPSTVE
jgi:predicted alpha/beta-hydrolase family hydrolase